MTKIEFIGKTLLVSNEKEKILVIGDLHLGYEESLKESGIMVPLKLFEEIINELDNVFEHLKKKKVKVSKVVLLGDVKHEFGKNRIEDYKEIGELMNYLRRKTWSVILVKGNHDVVVKSVVKKLDRVELMDYFVLGGVAYVHGDKDFPEIHARDIKTWIIGHGHPAIVLEEKKGSKKEKYKCFLDGKFKGRRVVVVPSFFDVNLGTDVLSDYMGSGLGLAWNFKLEKFIVKIVSDDASLEVLDFGKLRNL